MVKQFRNGIKFWQDAPVWPEFLYQQVQPHPLTPVVNTPSTNVDDIARQMQQQFKGTERKLHEEMAATRQSARQVVDQKEGELKQALERAQKSDGSGICIN